MKLAWLTDVHFDFLHEHQINEFGEKIAASNSDAVVISGDISNAKQLVLHLSIFEKAVKKPIYYVLGNHDYYGSSIEQVREKMNQLSTFSERLHYLPSKAFYAVSDSSVIIGHDGWYDCGHGDAYKSRFIMSDWHRIANFASATSKGEIVDVAQKLAHAGVLHVHDSIKKAVKNYSNIMIVTHFPPFIESHVYNGKVADDDAKPWYTSKMMGDMLMDASKAFPRTNFTVLCGHTHGKIDVKMADNLVVRTGGWQKGQKDYGNPILQDVVFLS